ncbi:hypothetical protein [Paracholeplasma manati]|uniref:hypothetical protein n=1 Tax=Paracholeplasma manati TaxID=591373 RepID=UPI00240850A6|nr:hypothetical protein [Paracholeplasma manati]MDG0889545.1 hypothetical protein [Paracholeplasma manati]
MKKYIYLFGYIFTIVLLFALNNLFWFTIGKQGQWIDNGISILFIFLFISVGITRSQYKDGYFERKNAFKTALWFGVPAILFLVMAAMNGFEVIDFGYVFMGSLFVLSLNYWIAGFLK